MPMLNFIDETYTARITAGETPVAMWAVVDTALGHTVLETSSCSNCSSESLAGTLVDVTATG